MEKSDAVGVALFLSYFSVRLFSFLVVFIFCLLLGSEALYH
jgi:hypothetical protein